MKQQLRDSNHVEREDSPGMPTVEASRSKVQARLVLFSVLVISGVYVAWNLRRGWIPPDDGALAQSAERVLQGELPHRDFEDVYTGGLAFLHAGAFKLLGTTLWSLRVAVFAAFLTWVPAVYAIASRFVRPVAAGAITLLAVVWSLPNYVAAMPSWYNLFLATFGVALLFRYVEDPRARWLVAAGVVGGLSFLVKVVGLYYIAGVLLFLVFYSHARARAGAGPTAQRGKLYAPFISGGLLLFAGALAALVRQQLHAPEVVHFVVPGVLIAALLAHNEWALPAGPDRGRFAVLAKMVLPFLAGAAIPIAIFLIPYARSGALGAFGHGVFVLPMKRFSVATLRVLPLWTLLGLVPAALLVVRAQLKQGSVRIVEAAFLALALVTILVGTGSTPELYRSVWNSVRGLVPALTIVGVAVLATPRSSDLNRPLLRAQTMVLLSVTAMCSLIQLPYASPIYFCYVAPLVVLTVVALSRYLRPVARVLPAVVLMFYAAFAVLRVNRTTMGRMSTLYLPSPPTERMATARGALDIPVFQREGYDRVISLLRQHARGGYTWAGPDAPEMYFLAGLKNPTRALYDIFDDSAGHTERVLRAIDSHAVTAVVVNRVPRMGFPRGVSPELDAGLAKRYPMSDSVGPLLVRWRD